MPYGAFVAGAINMFNQNQANKASAKQALLDRKFQERMARNQYQYMVADLEKAGLNKALAYGNTPGKVSGATASQGAATMPEPDFAGALSKRAQAKLSQAQVNTALAQEELTKNSSDKVKAETATILATLPEQIKLIRSTTAKNDAESMANPWKWGYQTFEESKKLIDPIERGVSSALDSYKKHVATPTQKGLDTVFNWFSKQYNNAKDLYPSLYNKVKEAYIKKDKQRKK